MENQLAIKVFKMDYSFLIKNYLNPEMWKQQWTLFEYKNFKITMNIYSIRTRDEEIMLDIRCYYADRNNNWDYKERCVVFSLKIEDVTFLKRQINSAIFDCITLVEREFIRRTNTYAQLIEMKHEESSKLYEIARNFLNQAGVTNENLIDVYEDAYVEEYAKVPDMIRDYEEGQIYIILTDLYLVWLSTLEDDPKKKIRTEEIKRKLSDEDYNKVMKQIEEFKSKFGTEEYEIEMQSKLEDI